MKNFDLTFEMTSQYGTFTMSGEEIVRSSLTVTIYSTEANL